MKLAHDRPTRQSARIYKLEQRMDALEPKITDMHDILVGLRQIGRVLKLIVYWAGGPTVVLGLAVAAWKTLLH